MYLLQTIFLAEKLMKSESAISQNQYWQKKERVWICFWERYLVGRLFLFSLILHLFQWGTLNDPDFPLWIPFERFFSIFRLGVLYSKSFTVLRLRRFLLKVAEAGFQVLCSYCCWFWLQDFRISQMIRVTIKVFLCLKTFFWGFLELLIISRVASV